MRYLFGMAHQSSHKLKPYSNFRPVYFTDLQRKAFLDAAAIANLNPLCLMHETTATALAYGIYKTDLPENDSLNVVFVDVGHASMQVCVAAFKKGQLKILAHTFDRSLGGGDC